MAASYWQRFKTPEQRFLECFKKGKRNRCWNWKKTFVGKYGQHFSRGKVWLAHRFAYTFFKGPIPKGLLVCHKCDNPRCVNPNHLWIGTYLDNKHDCMKKKRHAFGNRHPARSKKYGAAFRLRLSGTNNSNASLTDSKVRQILKLHKEGKTQVFLAKRYGVWTNTIANVVHRRNWRHVHI